MKPWLYSFLIHTTIVGAPLTIWSTTHPVDLSETFSHPKSQTLWVEVEPLKPSLGRAVPPQQKKVLSPHFAQSSQRARPTDYNPYFKSVVQHIQEHLHYPMRFKGKGWRGTTRFRLMLSALGKIESLEVLRSSGHLDLDQFATRALKRMEPFPRFGTEMKQLHSITLQIPVSFELEEAG